VQCEKCNKQIDEGNFVQMPAHVRDAKGVRDTLLQIVACKECCTTITQRIAGSIRIIGPSKPFETVQVNG
jgi:hypothetical protein